jgi:Ca-activated chloride channel family protein
MTDGENNAGLKPEDFATEYGKLDPAVKGVHTYPVLFGDANKDAMGAIASQTGGTMFDATTTSLQTIFKQIRGYQ